MVEGIIVKGIAGFYYVRTTDGIYECKARGIFKKNKVTPLVGDKVKINILSENPKEGWIEEIGERNVELFRPAVANVDQAVIVFALKSPDPHLNLLDKILLLGEYAGLELTICFNKADLMKGDDAFERYKAIYELAGYNVVMTSTKTGEGIDEIRDLLKNKISVFAGPSGVGKSSMLNVIQPGLQLKTGEVSAKIKRGKHTTRHTELIELEFGGWVVDTPGFTSLDLDFIDMAELSDLFQEFREFEGHCRFNDCMHINEPDCAVKAAIETGHIHQNRYDSYLYFYNNLADNRRHNSW